MSALRLSVIVPVFNEERTIAELLKRVAEVDVPKEIVVVDDGSTDGTPDVLAGAARRGLRVIRQPENRGKGTAIREGLRHVSGDAVLVQDADLELDPADYPRLLEPLRSGQSRVVYGSRFLEPAGPVPRQTRLANQVLTSLTNVLYGSRLTDVETGHKLFLREAIMSVPLTCRRFEFEAEITAKLLRRGERIVEVPVGYWPRGRADGKKIGWRDGVQTVGSLLRHRLLPVCEEIAVEPRPASNHRAHEASEESAGDRDTKADAMYGRTEGNEDDAAARFLAQQSAV